MPKAYFDPETLSALGEVFSEAKRMLAERYATDDASLDLIAERILHLAADGMAPGMILHEIDGLIRSQKGTPIVRGRSE